MTWPLFRTQVLSNYKQPIGGASINDVTLSREMDDSCVMPWTKEWVWLRGEGVRNGWPQITLLFFFSKIFVLEKHLQETDSIVLFIEDLLYLKLHMIIWRLFTDETNLAYHVYSRKHFKLQIDSTCSSSHTVNVQ